MSAELAINEIQRFLASDEAEVLCVKGRWGVGKTYAWRYYLEDAREKGKLQKADYAYVSLFGLNSPDELRYAIFESTVSPSKAQQGPDAETFGELVTKGKSIGRQARGWIGPALSTVGLGEIGNTLARSAFLLVRNQLICLDDLERAGASLSARDVLGLVSFLKEQRNCRVVLLLNDEAMEQENKADFDRLLEKVVDTPILFAPSAAEAVAIAITGDSPVNAQLKHGVITLGITNIRVIKKIERMVYRLAAILQPFREEILTQAVTACLLAGWSTFERDHAPSMEFVRDYNALLAAMQDRDNGAPDETVRWRDLLSALPFSHPDDLDSAIFDGVAAGYFDEERLLAEAKTLEEQLARQSRDNPLSKAWDSYHQSLAGDDATVIDAIQRGAMESLEITDSLNINGTIAFLRECGRNEQADEIARAYVAAQPDNPRFFDIQNHHFSADRPIDAVLREAFAERLAGVKDDRDPKAILLTIGHGEPWQDEDIRLLATVTSDAYVAMIEGTQGQDLKLLVQTALQVAGRHQQDAPEINTGLTEALSFIAAKSPLRARRLRQWGFVGTQTNRPIASFMPN
jgi:hypothetical protein